MIKKHTTLLLLFCLMVIQHGRATTSDFEIVKKRVLNRLMEQSVRDKAVEDIVNSITPYGTWSYIDYIDVSNEGFQHSRHTENMVLMARAHQTKGSKLYKSKKAKQAIILALTHWVENDYICENWWHNQVGTPTNLVNLMLLIGDELPKDLVQRSQPIIQRAHVDAPGARPGGDRIKIAGIQAKNLLFIGDSLTFAKVIKVIETEIKPVEWIGREYGYMYKFHESGFGNRTAEGRGMQHDNSFHHRTDGVNNTLSYGLDYANAFIEWAVNTANTQYAFSEDKIEKLVDYYLDGICKMMVFGKYPDAGKRNRTISRQGDLRPYNASSAENLMKTTNYRRAELQEIADIRNNGIKPTLSHATFFWNTEHFTYQRPEWFTSVRMYSTRTHNMEIPYNSEGLKNHHRGDGANHISRTGDEYYDIFPVFDYQKIPGTTIMQKEALPDPNQVQKLGLTDFVGAVTDGKYGAVAFDFKSAHDPLIARKSWFFFDEEYVALGSGISCTRSLPVVTTLNQCLLRGDVRMSINGSQSVIPKGEEQYDNVDWVFHDGIGYLFPEKRSVELMNDKVTGSWWDITKQTTTNKEPVTKEVFKLWIDHGKRPSDASYAYIVVPATTPERMAQLHTDSHIEILANTLDLQAVCNSELNIIQAVFYKGGHITLDGKIQLSSDNQGAVIVKMRDGQITEITVSDPSRELVRFNLEVSTKIEAKGDNFITMWDAERGKTHISIVLPLDNYAGDSVTIQLN